MISLRRCGGKVVFFMVVYEEREGDGVANVEKGCGMTVRGK